MTECEQSEAYKVFVMVQFLTSVMFDHRDQDCYY